MLGLLLGHRQYQFHIHVPIELAIKQHQQIISQSTLNASARIQNVSHLDTLFTADQDVHEKSLLSYTLPTTSTTLYCGLTWSNSTSRAYKFWPLIFSLLRNTLFVFLVSSNNSFNYSNVIDKSNYHKTLTRLLNVLPVLHNQEQKIMGVVDDLLRALLNILAHCFLIFERYHLLQ